MVDKSTLGIIVFSSLVLLLTFRDLVTTKRTEDLDKNDDEIPNNVNSNDELVNSKLNEDSSSLNQGFDGSNVGGDFVKKIPSLKMKSNLQTLKFKFCYSCGYRNMFEQYSQIIRQRYPELSIIGENYNPSPWKVSVAQFLGSFKMVLIGVVLFGVNPFTYLNMPTPNIFVWATENKMYACMMLFFISNAIETQLITTGAFEVYLNDIQIWSKLESDRMPHEKELLQILDMNFNFESQKQTAFV